MADLQGVIVFLLIVIGIVMGVVGWSRRKRLVADNYALLASRLGGRFDPGGFVEAPAVEADHNGVRYRLTHAAPSDSDSGSTRMVFKWSRGAWLRIRNEGVLASFRKLFGAQDIVVGDSIFDEKFLVQGRPDRAVRALLDNAARAAVLALNQIGRGVSIDMNPGELVIEVPSDLSMAADALNDFVDRGIDLFTSFQGRVGAEKVTFVDVSETGAMCLVCGGPFEEASVACPKCATPHHGDCWTYFGGCAVYACGARIRRS